MKTFQDSWGFYSSFKLGGDVAMLSGPSGLDLTLFRVNGFKDYVSKYPGMKVVAEKGLPQFVW